MPRAKNEALPNNDEDYIALYKPLCDFFAALIVRQQRMKALNVNEDLLNEHLSQRGMLFVNGRLDLLQLRYLLNYFQDDQRMRGTFQIFEKMAKTGKPVDGEFLRLVGYEPLKEFVYALRYDGWNGWNLDDASATTEDFPEKMEANKSYEVTEDIQDLSKYPYFGPLTIVDDAGLDVAEFIVPTTESYYIGVFMALQLNKLIVVDERIDYKLQVQVKMSGTPDTLFFMGIRCYDEDYNELIPTNTLGNPANFGIDNEFFPVDDEWFFINMILFHSAKTPPADPEQIYTNLGPDAYNLILPEKAKFIVPWFGVQNNNPGDVYFRFKQLALYPLVNGLRIDDYAYEMGSLDSDNFLQVIYENNNPFLSDEEIEETARHFLLPYDTAFRFDSISI
jgi:hypothetical protein